MEETLEGLSEAEECMISSVRNILLITLAVLALNSTCDYIRYELSEQLKNKEILERTRQDSYVKDLFYRTFEIKPGRNTIKI